MIKKTNASFRAIREECGMTQNDLAEEFDVTLRSVKRWEHPNKDYQPPDDVWEWLLECRENLYQEAQNAADSVLSRHKGTSPVAVAYYRTQEELDARQLSVDRDYPVGYTNAITREAVRILEREKHIDVGFEYSLDFPEIE